MAVLEVRLHPQRGRGLYTTRHVQGGETVLMEAPTLLTVPMAMSSMVCANCLRCVKDQVLQTCQGCGAASFCSPQCQQHAHSTAWVHGPAVCSVYKALAACSNASTPVTVEEQDIDAGRFLAHTMLLKVQSSTAPEAATRWASLQALQGQATDVELRIAQTLMPVLQAAAQGSSLPLTVQEMADLLRKEQLNSYGILAPSWFSQLQQGLAGSRPAAGQTGTEDAESDDSWHRILRGSAVYAWASLINHECNPNIARFDNFDIQGPNNTHVVFRAMHDLPKGTEVFQSYFPVSWDYEERQEHLQHVYGFTCHCQRCKLEESWSPHIHDAEEGDDGMQAGDDKESEGWETDDGAEGDMLVEQETAQADQATGSSSAAVPLQGMGQPHPYIQPNTNADIPIQPQEADPGPLDPTYLQLYLLKYVCSVPDCYGTLAPRAPGSQQYECCVCGTQRSEAQFLAELEA